MSIGFDIGVPGITLIASGGGLRFFADTHTHLQMLRSETGQAPPFPTNDDEE